MTKIANAKLADKGKLNFEWAKSHMGALTALAAKHSKGRPLEGVKIGLSLHVTKETSVLIDALLNAGADVKVSGANPLSTQDDIAAYLSTRTDVWAWRGESAKEYGWCLDQVLATRPMQLVDDGADLNVAALKSKVKGIDGSSEETTTGVVRLRALEADGLLSYPIIAVNDAQTKFLFDNRHGTGQSTMDGILRATALLIAGKRVVVVGFGWVGRGIAARARGLGARVTVVEVDPIRAIEAHLDGFEVSNIEDAAKDGDLFITATGQKNVVPFQAMQKMKQGAMLANAGHFDVEIDVGTLMAKAKGVRAVRENVDEIQLPSGKSLYLIGKGRIANLVAAEGHPPEVMQMSFADQFMAALYIRKNYAKMEKKVVAVPAEIDREVAQVALESLGSSIDAATKEQLDDGKSWSG